MRAGQIRHQTLVTETAPSSMDGDTDNALICRERSTATPPQARLAPDSFHFSDIAAANPLNAGTLDQSVGDSALRF
jgi:hypothetical protein